MQTMFQRLDAAAATLKSFVCVGLDPTPERVPVRDILAFNKAIIDSTKDVVAAYKPQFAYYEALGIDGLRILEGTIQHIRDVAPDHIVVGDAKRGDISTTAKAYASALFEFWDFDIATIYAYQGTDSVEPFLEYEGKGVYIVCRTSNPSSGDIQDLIIKGEGQQYRVFDYVANIADRYAESENVGLVVGATYPRDLLELRRRHPKPYFLIPGVGVQGGDAEQTALAGANEYGRGFIVNSSRGIIYASSDPEHYANAARNQAKKLKDQINGALSSNNSWQNEKNFLNNSNLVDL
ncbi:MAG: orotidine-5'-phosphate decarboxylase [SAR202 cluster bacterium]|nr:orotidine-5'-phosphate decarboxylase [SAR202 cluster bacterium]